MKIPYNQLAAHLTLGLSTVYLITGEEILFLQEAEALIRASALEAGFSERLRFTADAQFDWAVFEQSSQQTSLFGKRQCIELNLSTAQLSQTHDKVLTSYLRKVHSDKVLIIRAGKLDASLQKTAWYKTIEKNGVIIPIWPLLPAHMPTWLRQRLHAVDLQADLEAIQLLALQTEGNLLAAAQAIEKLNLLYPKTHLTTAHILEIGMNDAHYNVFGLIDAILKNEPVAVIRVLNHLRMAGVEPSLILWALAREIRQWLQWLEKMQQGQALSQLLVNHFALKQRQTLIAQTLRQHSQQSLYACLRQAACLDQMIKGTQMGNIWEAFCQLALALTGIKDLPGPTSFY